MQLEKIEMTGFKSFADKTVIEFDKGVTAVVGPNGSGKSNLSEAIKWVLGEQSAKSLRGKKMDDVIFAGSETRKSVNIAEVNLYINNQDGVLPVEQTQVVLTRRLNRNGDSDFFINKKPCRLKDITNLMMDSGLGKDSFALISQGKVEKIFNDKPEERRSIIEEAAGVLKYKDRKSQALRKLGQTQEHLNRVQDILHEIHSQLEPLEEQREKAIHYLSKKEELTNIETALLAVEIETLNSQWKVSKNELALTESEIARFQREQVESEGQIDELEGKLDSVESELDAYQENYVTLIQELEKIDGERKVLIQRQEFVKQTDEENQASLVKAEEQEEQVQAKLEEAKRQEIEKNISLKNAKVAYDHTVEALRQLTAGSEEYLKELREKYFEAIQEESKLGNQETYLEKSLDTNLLQKEKFVEELEETRESIANLSDEIDTIVVKQEINEEASLSIEKQLKAKQEKLGKHRQDYQELKQGVDREQAKLQQAKANYESLKQVSEDYAGYYQGVREVLKQKTQLPGLIGSVAELIKVPNDYVLAIEIALGANSQFVVVENESSAAQAIQFLKKRRAGRATFLPLTVIKGRSLGQDIIKTIEQSAGFIGLASDLVDSQDKYSQIISNLLGSTIIVDNLSSAQALAKNINYRHRIISLEGDVMNSGGAMTGGATKANQSQSILSRTSQLEARQKEIAQLSETIEKNSKTLQAIEKKGQSLLSQVQELESQLNKNKIDFKDQNLRLTYVKEQVTNLEKQANSQDYQINSLLEEYESLEEQYSQTVGEKKRVSALVSQMKKEMDLLQLSQEDRLQRVNDLQKQLEAEGSQKAVLQEQVNQQVREILHLQEELKQISEHITILKSKKEEQIDNIESDQKNYQQVLLDLESSRKELDKVDAALTERKTQKNDLDLQLKQVEVKRNQAIHQLQQLYKQVTKIETKANRYEYSIDQKLLYLNEEYELTFEAAASKTNLDISIEEAGKLVRSLKQAIDQIGSVNILAIEEYQKVSDRFDFISIQQKDLLEAKGILEDTINEMDDEVKKRFKTTFDAIQQQFEKTFPRLFGGGKATLTLTDPDNLLETGIDIIAQPPGKKLQSLTLLSGGERAFTAIALLFAILEVKPVPFCLLDEVEAALDESNVSRYGRYLKDFTQDTQFIVITHRRGTMEEADVLYGVTMQESGVSRLASVKFEDYEVLEKTNLSDSEE